MFLIGSAYFVSGSYPHSQQFYYAEDRSQNKVIAEVQAKREVKNIKTPESTPRKNMFGSSTKASLSSLSLPSGMELNMTNSGPLILSKSTLSATISQSINRNNSSQTLNPLHSNESIDVEVGRKNSIQGKYELLEENQIDDEMEIVIKPTPDILNPLHPYQVKKNLPMGDTKPEERYG